MTFHKNGNRYTAVNGGIIYIQVMKFKNASKISYGTNQMICADCVLYDVEINKEEFLKQLNQHVHELSMTLYLFADAKIELK